MSNPDSFDLSDIDSMMSVVSSIFSELNIGLLIYHLEHEDQPRTLKLIYANPMASEYTGTNLDPLIGHYITDAFPGLADTDLPEVYADVATTKRSRNLGAFEYSGDDKVEKGYFSVKAFPIPNKCVGVVFENITVRKQLEAMVKKLRDKEPDR